MPPDDSPRINDHPRFQRVFWRVQRVAWVVLGGLLIAAMVGLTGGSGPFAAEVIDEGDLRLTYPTIVRANAPGQVRIEVTSPRSATLVHLDRAFLETFEVRSVTPAPEATLATGDGVAYRVLVSGTGRKTVQIEVSAQRTGRAFPSVTVDGRLAMLSVLVLP